MDCFTIVCQAITPPKWEKDQLIDGSSSACFEYLGAEEHCHKTSCFHCKCEKCGKLIHLHCEDVVKLEQHLMESHGFQMDPCRTVFYGICEDCRKSEAVHIKGK